MTTTTTTNAWVLYCMALGLDGTSTMEQVTAKFKEFAANGAHPDHGGDAEKFALLSAAYTELKKISNKKRGKFTSKSDEAWLRSWEALGARAEYATTPSADEPKAEQPTTKKAAASGFVFTDIEGEDKTERAKRYAREYCKFRYDSDPDYAARRKAQSSTSHKKARDAKKAEAAA